MDTGHVVNTVSTSSGDQTNAALVSLNGADCCRIAEELSAYSQTIYKLFSWQFPLLFIDREERKYLTVVKTIDQ